MLHIDPWEKVAECERYLQAAGDSTHRKILTDVRDLWIGLANARNFLTAAEFDHQVETPCAAKFVTSSICLSVNGRTSLR
jgi:hypothetical protein